MRTGIFAIALTLSLATFARAGIDVTATSLGPATWANGTPQELPGFTAWRVNFATNDGYQMLAMDFWTPAITSGQFAHPNFGVFGPLAQRWTWNQGDEVWDASPYKTHQNGTTNGFSNDSHFLHLGTYPSQLAPVEDNNRLGLLGRNNDSINSWGMGSYIRLESDMPATASMDLLYLVVPDGQQVHIVGQIATTSPINLGKVNIDAYVAPEPSGVALLLVGALVLLRRRHVPALSGRWGR